MSNLSIMTIGGVECYEKDGTAYLKLETVARGLGFTTTQNINGIEYENVRWSTVKQYMRDIGFLQEVAKDDYIPENVFYRLAMKAKNEAAVKFQALVADEIIPSIRKTGSYGTPQTVRMSDALAAMANVARLAEDNQRRLDAIEASTKELDSKLDKAAEAFTAPSFAADKWQENARATIAAIVQENGLSYQAYTGELYQRLESVACVNLKSRQSFKQKRMKEQGATYRDRQAVTKLNVIADDPKLRAVFDHILAMEKASRLMKGGRTA